MALATAGPPAQSAYPWSMHAGAGGSAAATVSADGGAAAVATAEGRSAPAGRIHLSATPRIAPTAGELGLLSVKRGKLVRNCPGSVSLCVSLALTMRAQLLHRTCMHTITTCIYGSFMCSQTCLTTCSCTVSLGTPASVTTWSLTTVLPDLCATRICRRQSPVTAAARSKHCSRSRDGDRLHVSSPIARVASHSTGLPDRHHDRRDSCERLPARGQHLAASTIANLAVQQDRRSMDRSGQRLAVGAGAEPSGQTAKPLTKEDLHAGQRQHQHFAVPAVSSTVWQDTQPFISRSLVLPSPDGVLSLNGTQYQVIGTSPQARHQVPSQGSGQVLNPRHHAQPTLQHAPAATQQNPVLSPTEQAQLAALCSAPAALAVSNSGPGLDASAGHHHTKAIAAPAVQAPPDGVGSGKGQPQTNGLLTLAGTTPATVSSAVRQNDGTAVEPVAQLGSHAAVTVAVPAPPATASSDEPAIVSSPRSAAAPLWVSPAMAAATVALHAAEQALQRAQARLAACDAEIHAAAVWFALSSRLVLLSFGLPGS